MPVTIISHNFAPPAEVEVDVLLSTIERNRDRVRTTAGMLLTLAGLLTSFSTAVVLFLADKADADKTTITFLCAVVLLFLTSAILAIASTFLRIRYPVLAKTQFVADILHLYETELRLLRFASLFTVLGLVTLAAAAVTAAIRWR